MPLPYLCARRARSTSAVALLAAVLGAAHLAAAAAPLSLQEAQSIAVARSPRIAAFGFAAEAGRQMAVAAGELPDPVLKIGVDNLPVEGPDRFDLNADFMTMRQVGVMQEITRKDKRELRARRSRLEAEKSAAQGKLATANVERDSALAWLDLHYARAMREQVAAQIAEARLQLEAAKSAYDAGRSDPADLIAARSAQALLEDRATDLDRRVRTARRALERWLGAAADRPLADLPPMERPPIPPGTLAEHVGRHPDLEVLRREEDIAANDVKLASAARRPDWSVELMYSMRGPAFSNMVSLSVSVPLQWDRPQRQDRELAAKLALREQAREERVEMLREHLAEVGAMDDEWRADRERLRRYRAEIVPLASRRVEAALAAYRGGKGSLAGVLSARRELLDARLAALQLEWDNARVWAQLAFLIPGTHDMGERQ